MVSSHGAVTCMHVLLLKQLVLEMILLFLATGFDAFLVFSADAHKSEYVAGEWLHHMSCAVERCVLYSLTFVTIDYEKRRAFLSGFTGSAGTAVVTQQKAALWTDGRYYPYFISHYTLSRIF